MVSHHSHQSPSPAKMVSSWRRSSQEHRDEAKLGLDNNKPRLVIEKSLISAEQDIKAILLMMDEEYDSVKRHRHHHNEAFAEVIAKQKQGKYEWLDEIPESVETSITFFSGGDSKETYVGIRYADPDGNSPYERLQKRGETGVDFFLNSMHISNWVDLLQERWLRYLAENS